MKNSRNDINNCSIARKMSEDHEKITEIFNQFTNEKNDHKVKSEMFSRFSKEFKTHMETEEIVMRSIRKNEVAKAVVPVASSLAIDHVKLLELLGGIEESVRKGEEIETGDFYMLLRKHKNVEDRLFYPELDRILDDKEKIKILERLK